VQGHATLAIPLEPEDRNPNLLPADILPPAGTPIAMFCLKDTGMCKIRDTQRRALFDRHSIRPWMSSHFP
jgi:hypothetical protein